ncbi:MAG: NGG1p interacting factor NIF3 [Gammaproteobacteria bacterium]|nr:NGG1p interacting factor NIF3 [Gammaproteobacteria bacterium]
MYSITYYIPCDDHERVKQALFDCGAGKIGHYDECCWEVLGNGQFRAKKGSKPMLGKVGQLEKVAEYKVEMVCEAAVLKPVLKTLLCEHPYEQPAYFVSQALTLEELN